jgi:arabinofuranosyltransferase
MIGFSPLKLSHMKKSAPFLLAALLLLACAVVLMGLMKQSYLDDPYITYRYAKNLVDGYGIRWNPGEVAVEGYTNFSWVLMTAAGSRMGIDPALFSRIVGGLSLLTLIVLLLSPANALVTSRAGRFFLAATVALCPVIAFYAVSGMETVFFTLLVVAGVLCYSRAPSPRALAASGLFFGLATLTRPEGGLFLLAALAVLAWEKRGRLRRRDISPWLPFFIPFFTLVFGHVLWRLFYYRSLVPNTYYAKYAGNGIAEHFMGLSYVADALRSYLLVPLVVIIVVHFLVREKQRPEPDRLLTFPLCGLGIYLAYLLWIGRDDTSAFPSFRFFVPILPLAYLVAARLVETTSALSPKPVAFAALSTISLLAFLPEHIALMKTTGAASVNDVRGLFSFPENFFGKPELAAWIEETTPPEASIAVPWAGRVPYFTRRNFIDTLGLNDAHIARQPKMQRGIDVKMDPDYVLARKPELIFLNVNRAVAEGKLPPTVENGVWKIGDRLLLEKLRTTPAYRLDPTAPTHLATFRRTR